MAIKLILQEERSFIGSNDGSGGSAFAAKLREDERNQPKVASVDPSVVTTASLYRTVCSVDTTTTAKSSSGSQAPRRKMSFGSFKSIRSKGYSKELEAQFDAFETELNTLVRLRHANIVLLMGAYVNKPDIAVVMEYMSRGDLMSLYDQDDIVVDWKLRMNFASDAANGM